MHEAKVDQNRNDEKTKLEKIVKIEEEKKESSTSAAAPTDVLESRTGFKESETTTTDTTIEKKEEGETSSDSPADADSVEDGKKATAMDVDVSEEEDNSTGDASSNVISNDKIKKEDDGDVTMEDADTEKMESNDDGEVEEKETSETKYAASEESKTETNDQDDNNDSTEKKSTNESKDDGDSNNDRNVVKSESFTEKESATSNDGPKPLTVTNSSGSASARIQSDKTENKSDAVSTKKSDRNMDTTEKNDEKKNGNNAAPAAAAAPPPPVMKGTLSIDLTPQRRHLIRGMWNYENSNTSPPQRFELVRNLGPDEDAEKLPVDGEFHGSFSLAYVYTTSKGKRKERSKVIPETGVKIKFTEIDNGREFKVSGKGTNQFGVFHINGTATPSALPGDKTLHVVLRKRYEPGPVVAAPAAEPSTAVVKSSKTASNQLMSSDDPAGPLPEPAKSFSTGVVALRGKLLKEESQDLGVTEIVHRITGMWASGLDLLSGDPQNTRGLCNRFEYEHKSSVPSQQFPVSGRYSGWFDLSNEDGSRTRINERDITLKFRKNSAGYYNIEGKGSNVFGKYTISGTLTKENVITIFRHFQPRKFKKSAAAPAAVVPGDAASSGAPTRRPSVPPFEPKLKLDDVKIPHSKDGRNSEPYEPIKVPDHGTYSAVSRGVLRLNDDGSHSCQGKWAVTRDHFTNGQTSNFNFRLESHFASEALKEQSSSGKGEVRKFPLDSAMYKGSFQLKKQGSRYQTIVDQQIVMKFRKNTQGAYNVHGTGINAIGEFNLLGTMIMSGKTGGQVELYRMYPPDKLAAPSVPKASATSSSTVTVAKPDTPGSTGGAAKSSKGVAAGPPPGGAQRRESSRNIKLPSRLEEDDPSAQLTRSLDKCSQILKFMREKDIELGAFFSEPVDPVALGIPTYYQIIKEPMDLRTIQRKMEAGEVSNPEEFARLVRLVFENAMTFNIDPAHSVHQAARNLLVMFNQKYRDVDRMVQSIRRTHGVDADFDLSKGKGGKKRKRQEEVKSLKRIRLEEAQAMTSANASAIAAIVAAAPANTTTVSRSEFNMMLHMIQQLQAQIVQTHKAVADLSPGEPSDAKVPATTATGSSKATYSAPRSTAPAPAPEKKKPTQRKSETKAHEEMVAIDDSAPLSLEEQELLTETINELPQEHLGGVIQIIREAAPVGADEDEIDLEIDQLEVKTQRKLLRHIMKFVKKSKPKGKKKGGKAQKKNNEKPPPAKKPKPAPKQSKQPAATATADSFFAFGGQDGSDSDSDDDDDKQPSVGLTGGKQLSKDASSEFKLNETLGFHDDDDDDIGADGIAANWNISQPSTEAEKKSEDKDDDWGASAREQAAAAKARDADRRAREEKAKAEAEQAKSQRLAEAAERAEELKAERAEKEAKEAKEKELKEKEDEEALQSAKDRAREELQSVKVTVDLGDEQRDIMKEYDNMDHDLGGASPSSDFGF